MEYANLMNLLVRMQPAVLDIASQRWDAEDVLLNPQPLPPKFASDARLNPQPLPPNPPVDRLLLEAAVMARSVVRLAVEESLRGTPNASLMIRELVDDWCDRQWPRKWPFPGPQLNHQGIDPERIKAARVAGALVFSSYASRITDNDLRSVLVEGAEKLTSAAIHHE